MKYKTKTSTYELEYFTSIIDDVKTVRIKWSIYDYNQTKIDREFTNSNNDYSDYFDTDSKFQLKILKNFIFPVQNPNLFSLTPRPKIVLKIFFKPPISMDMSAWCRGPNCVSNIDRTMVEANVWQLMSEPQYAVNENTDKNVFYFEFSLFVDNKSKDMPLPQLHNDLENLLNNSMFSDITMKSSEGVEFHVHKAILAARSDVLKAHFEHNTRETLTNIVESPFETDVLRLVLTFIYTDHTPEFTLCHRKMPQLLFVAADYYQIERLKKLCEEAIQKILSVENVIEILKLAHLHSATGLEEMALEFIDTEKVKLLMQTPDWKKLQSVDIVKSIFEHIFLLK